MIGKQTKGSGFRGTLNYVLGKDGAEIVGGNMLSQGAKGLAQEFAESRKLKPNLGRAVYHASLSLPPGETLGNDRWGEVADRYMEGMGFKGAQYVAVKHNDTAHSHIHIVASRVRMDGTVVSESHDFRRSEEHIRGLEKEFNLTPTLPSRASPARAPTSGEMRQAIREKEPSAKLKLQTIINQSAQQSKSIGELFNHLEGKGVSVIPNIASTGHVSGISFKLGDEMMKGSDLGRSFTWQGLQKRGISYDHDRDIQRLVQSRERAKSREGGRAGERTASSQSLVHARSSGGAGAPGQIHESTDPRNHRQHPQIARTQRGDGERDLGSRQIRQPGDKPAGEKHREHSTQATGGSHGTDSRYFSGSGEHILRMAASVLESGRGSGKMGSVRDQDFTDTRSKKSGFHLEDVAIVKEALIPLDDEKERKHKEEEQERQRIREREQRRRKAHEKDRGHEIGFSR